jgi:hypothetical protein
VGGVAEVGGGALTLTLTLTVTVTLTLTVTLTEVGGGARELRCHVERRAWEIWGDIREI